MRPGVWTVVAAAVFLASVPLGAQAAEVVLAAAAAAGTVGVTQGVAVIFGAAFLKQFAVNLAITALGGLLGGKPKQPSFTSEARDRLHVVRSAIESRRLVYGEVLTAGPLVWAYTHGHNNGALELAIPLAGHEVTAITDVHFDDRIVEPYMFNDETLALPAVDTGPLAGAVSLKKFLGTSGQTAHQYWVDVSGGDWTSAHRLRGVAYLAVSLNYQVNTWPSGIPNIRARVKGKAVYDPRDAGTRYTRNPALILRDYLTASYGLGAATSAIDDTLVNAAANACDERVTMATHTQDFTVDLDRDWVKWAAPDRAFDTGDGVTVASTGTLPGGLAGSTTYYVIRVDDERCQLATSHANALAGTAINLTTLGSGTHTASHVDQTRYTWDGTLNTADDPQRIIEQLVSAMAGACVYAQGKWRIFAGVYASPTVTLTADDLRGPVSLRAKPPRRELYNAVRGTFADAARNWQPTDFPPVVNATYESQDGGERIYRDIELPGTTNYIRAQRIGKVHLEKSRQGLLVSMPCNFKQAFGLAVWDTVQVTLSQLGWSAKVFRVIGWELAADAGGVDLTLQEDSSASYNWSSGDATTVDTAPDTNLPDADTIRRTPPPNVSGLAIIGAPLSQTFTGGDCKLTWRHGANHGSFEYGSELFGANDGALDFYFRDYEVRVYNASGTLLRTEHVLDNSYTYTFEKNFADTSGVPVRTFRIEVRQRTKFDQTSTVPAIVEPENDAPTAPSLTLTAYPGGFQFSYTKPTDPDFRGVKIYASLTSGFTPGASNLVYEGDKVAGVVSVRHPGLRWYVKVEGVDLFGAGSAGAQQTVDTRPAFTALPQTGVVGSDDEVTLTQPNEDLVFVPQTGYIYLHTGGDKVTVYDPLLDEEVIVLTDPFSAGPWTNMIYAPNVNRIYRTGGSRYLQKMNPQTLAFAYSATGLDLGANTTVRGGAYCPSNGYLYLADYGNERIIVLDPSDDSVVATIATTGYWPMGKSNGQQNGAFADSSETIYFTENNSHRVLAIDTSSNTLAAAITCTGSEARAIAYVPNTDRVYCIRENGVNDIVSVINPNTNTEVSTISLTASPGSDVYQRLVWVPERQLLYTIPAGLDGQLNVIDPVGGAERSAIRLSSITVNVQGMVWCPRVQRLYPQGAYKINAVRI